MDIAVLLKFTNEFKKPYGICFALELEILKKLFQHFKNSFCILHCYVSHTSIPLKLYN